MNDSDGLRLEAAEQYGFEEIDGQNPPGQPGYFCTEEELIAFAKACERAGRAEAATYARKIEADFDRRVDNDADNAETGRLAFASGVVAAIAQHMDEQNAVIDAELAPLRRKVHALHDFLTHRATWRSALEKMRDQYDDEGDRSYWDHELRAFDKAFDTLAPLISDSE